uniref:Golgin subfamily A member 5 n=1 Tax=Sparus aurata TaxID=8175 RepID=A0A671XA54_SPAAU
MSWFADLAGKAEDFLNKVDQGAATALTTKNQGRSSSFSSPYEEESTDKPEYNTAGYQTNAAVTHHDFASSSAAPSFISAAAGNIKKSNATLLGGSANMASKSSASGSSAANSAKISSGFVRPKKSEDVDDDLLFDFLNSSDPPVSNRSDSRRELAKVAVPFRLRLGCPSGVQQAGASCSSHRGAAEPDTVQSAHPESKRLWLFFHVELNQTRLRADRWTSEQSQTDRMLREFRSQVDDLTEALSAKDGQLAVLKIRLDEADQLLKSRSTALDEAQKEKLRLMQDHTEGSSMHSQALETLQERLREAETTLRREQDSYRQMQIEYSGRLSKVESERQTLAETVSASERRGGEEKLRVDDLQQQLKSAKAAAESAKQELQDYKHKASRILQSKEKLISSLKEGSGLDNIDGSGAMALELEDLRHDKELQREEIQKLQGQVHTLRTEIQDLENQALMEAESWREQQAQLEEQQALQNRAKQEMEAEVERYKQELQYLEEEQHRSKTTLQSRMKDREDEIQKLRNQLTNKTISNSQTELENRLHQLTETLIQKQTMLEALGTEKSSLVFQLERLEQQLKNAQGGQSGGPAINMSGLEGPGARQRNAPILFSDQDSPGVYGKVRKAASTIDRFSIRLGIFLRRYPMARVFVILYMAVLHLWVMIVLLTYTPEMHHSHPGGR